MWLAVRYRRLQALMLLALAALITACAVLTPLYDRAMQQALTRLTIGAASSSDTAIQFRSLSRLTSGAAPGDARPASPNELDDLAGLLPAAFRPWFGARIDSASLLVVRADLTSRSPTGELLWRDGACAQVRWSAGGCPQQPGEIAVTAADARNFGLDPGAAIDVREQPAVAPDRTPPVTRLRVSGVYQQVPGEYWDGRLLAGLSGSIDPQQPNRPFHDTWLTARGSFAAGGVSPRWIDPGYAVAFNLNRSRIGVDEALQLGPLVTALRARTQLRVDDEGAPINGPNTVLADVQSQLPEIAATIDAGRRQALVTVPLLMIQLGLLGLFVLGLVLGAAVEQRRPEVALARLRGSGRRGARRLVSAELVPVVLAGVPVGVAGALGLAAVARHAVLRDAAGFELQRSLWTTTAGVTVLLAGLTWLTAARGTRDPVSALLRSVPARAPAWRLGLADAVVIAAAGTAVLAFVTGGLRGPLALAAPALLALVVGLGLAHLIVPVATWSGRQLMARGRYAAGLAALATARRPATRRVVTVIAVASALLVFSTHAIGVGARNRQLAAERDTGAAMVADLTGTDVASVRRALATVADPLVTPVVRVAPTGNTFRTTLAVVPADFGRIALLPGVGPIPWAGLAVPTGRRISLTGREISLRVTPTSFTLSASAAYLQLELVTAGGDGTSVDLGAIPTARPATLRAVVPCRAGCTVAGVSIRAYPGVRYGGQITLGDVRVAGGATNLPGAVGDWRAGVAGGSRVEPSTSGSASAAGTLTLHLVSDGYGPLGMASRYFPTALPAVVAAPSGTPIAGAVNGNGLNGDVRSLAPVARLQRAPGTEGAAAIVDLDLQQHWGTRVAPSARLQVWFADESPARLARVRAALQDNGIEVSAVRRASQARRAYDTSVPAWSLQLGLLAAVAGLLIAALVLVLLAAGGWRRRSRDLACLAMTGVPRRGRATVAVGEQLPIVLPARHAGAGCGQLGAVLALPTVPLFARPRPAASLDLSTPWPSVLAVLATELVGLGLVAWLCGRVVAGRARLGRVRESL